MREMFDNDIFSQEEEEISGCEEGQDSLLQKALNGAIDNRPPGSISHGEGFITVPRNPNNPDEGLYVVVRESKSFSSFVKIGKHIPFTDEACTSQIETGNLQQTTANKCAGKRNAVQDKWAIFNYSPLLGKRKCTTSTPIKKRKTAWDEVQPLRLSKDIYEEVQSGQPINVEKINPNCVYQAKRIFSNMFTMHKFDVLSERGRPAKVKLDPIKPFIDLFKIGALYKGDVNKCLTHVDRVMLYGESGYVFNYIFNFKGTALRCKLDYWLTPEMFEYSKRVNDSVSAKQCTFGDDGRYLQLEDASDIYDMYK